uniref:Major facilitator superfamily (MFS) profile domain-containing protein n=1 Tax=Candidatus Methanophaga sp. ANME-1 ERB7 TaxID=2759913 RepID=A0A7G9Z2F3_9EURY|nr:hypothetical protein IPKNHHKO_00011 [Methanosarcinales archaeon ANME-1 ERB7]
MAMNMVYSFIAAAMGVLVPLYLIEREMDIAAVGLVLSIMPLGFMILRIIFASMADGAGTRAMSIVYSAASIISITIYSIAINPAAFMLARFFESIRASGFWAVIRTDILSFRTGERTGNTLAFFGSFQRMADGAGRLAVGFMIAFFSFSGSFWILAFLSIALLLLSLSFNSGKPSAIQIDMKTVRRIFSRRERGFWFNSIGITSISLNINILLGFLLPLFASAELGFAPEKTGIMLAILPIFSGLVMLLFLKMRLGGRPLLLFTFLMVPALLLLPILGESIFLLVFILAAGNGCANILAECILADAVKNCNNISTEIAVLHVPLRISEFLFMSIGGLVIAAFGFAPLFFVCATLVGLFVLFAKGYVK